MAGFYMNDQVTKISRSNPTLANKINKQFTFLTNEDIPEVEKVDRMMLVLVRCGNGRFLCPVQNAIHFCNIIDKEGTDYVRDVSFPSNG
jgi:hypothetical protein